jgi:predicted phage terminase large subunit-like protein
MEFDRAPEEKFYLPRRKQLKPFVDAIQDLEDDRLDELFTSCSPRIGKTTLADFALTWVAGRHPCESNLYSSCSDTVTKVFYNGLIELIKDTVTYHFDKVFPNSPLVKANADYQTINLLRNDRYPTITCRSIDGTLNGACDCSHFQIGDDLCKGIEQAMNKDVMMRLWQKVQNDFLTRGKQGVKRWWIGTRWSLIDPQGIRQDMLSNDPNFKDLRWKVINIPALNENEESNFNYKYGVGFDSKSYKRIRAGFERNDDLASWSAQYQGKPIEREGSLFSAGEMRFYNGVLPEGEPNRIFIALDPSWGGGDYCAGPVCVQYGDDIYIPDVVYTNEDKRKSLPMIGHVIRNNGVRSVQIEANKMTEGYADELRDELRKMNIMCTITTKPAPPNMRKEDRIRDRAPEIRGNMIFLESGIRTKTYQSFMDNVFSFTIIGKNKHDDAPDSLSMAADMVFKRGSVYAQVFKRFI